MRSEKYHQLAEEIASLLLKVKAVKFNFKQPTVFSSGVVSPVYIDNRVVISYPRVREVVLGGFLQVIKDKVGEDNVDVISGTATAAIPFAALVAQRLDKGMIYVRSKEKGHGKENKIEGIVKKGERVVIVEDHVSSGGSAINNVLTIRNAGAEVNYCLAITSYELKLAKNLFKKHKVKLVSLTDFQTLIEIAEKQKTITGKKKKLLVDWWKSPVTWAFT